MVDNSLQNNNYGLGLYSNNSLQNSTQTAGKTTSGEKELEQAKDNKVKDNEAVSLSKNVEKAVDTKSISKSNEFENFQNKINSFTTDNKTIKDIQEDMKLLSSADGEVDTKKVNDRINQNIDKLQNLSQDEKDKLKENLNGVDNLVNNNIKGIQDAAKEMQDFIKNTSIYCIFRHDAMNIYKAGECFPLLGPLGCLIQFADVKLATFANFCPQYSQ